ncbi:unnamed protein product [Phytophthora lilii]|uniref:Unnamed protein product n=1 Tax=Phytophthora lilii TaxID=2077276 RepID=A0A9W7D9T4_9STRA|nr:unnamed protein product [Phytophthora lilii]
MTPRQRASSTTTAQVAPTRKRVRRKRKRTVASQRTIILEQPRRQQLRPCVIQILSGRVVERFWRRRIKFYTDSSLEMSEEIREHVAAQGQILAVEKLLDYQCNAQKKDYDVPVSWKGLESIEDSWESSKTLI